MTTGKRRDANHSEIIEVFKRYGAVVHDMADVGGGFPDLIVNFGEHTYFVEVKDGAKPISGRRLTKQQRALFANFGAPVYVVFDVGCVESILFGPREWLRWERYG